MPRHSQRFPHAHPRRRPRARFALVGAAAALGVLLVIPAAAPRASVLDIGGAGSGTNAVVEAPVASPVDSVAPTPEAVAPRPSGTPNPRVGTATRPADIGVGRPPSRLASELRGTKAPAISILTGYRWPLAHPRLTLPFGPTPWGSRLVGGRLYHDGIDLATFCGDRVVAAHAGRVLAAGRRYDDVMGWVGDLSAYYRRLDRKQLWMTLPIVVVIDDGNGYRSMYAHFGRIVVKKGQVVKAGQLLGYEGATGRASGCHVHYGLFSPWETRTFRLKPDTAKRMKLPAREIARVDPLRILPKRAGINAPKHSKAPGAAPAKGTATSP